MPRVVLIGGPGDGMRKMIDQPYPILRITVSQPFDSKRAFDTKIPMIVKEIPIYEYEYMEFYGIGFYMHKGMRKDLLIQKLLAGYYPNE